MDESPAPSFGQPAGPAVQKSGGVPKWVWVVVLVVVLGGVLCCGGTALFTNMAMGKVGEMMATELAHDETVQAQIGTVSDVSLSWSDTISEQQTSGNSELMVWDIVGDKASGKLHVELRQGAQTPEEVMKRATLIVNGESFELVE